MQINRTLGASILTALAYVLTITVGDVGNVGESFASPGVMLNILTPVIVYIFSKLAFGDAALNSWLVVIINFSISLRFILKWEGELLALSYMPREPHARFCMEIS